MRVALSSRTRFEPVPEVAEGRPDAVLGRDRRAQLDVEVRPDRVRGPDGVAAAVRVAGRREPRPVAAHGVGERRVLGIEGAAREDRDRPEGVGDLEAVEGAEVAKERAVQDLREVVAVDGRGVRRDELPEAPAPVTRKLSRCAW